jgi:integrase/recombinase XerD
LHTRNQKLSYRRPGKAPGAVHVAGDPETLGGFRGFVLDLLAWMAACAFSPTSIKGRRIELGYFVDWCEERAVSRPDEVTRALLERYRQHVFNYRRKDNGAGLSFQTQSKRLVSVRVFFQWMTRQHHLLYNPASELELPRAQKRLPRNILSVAEIEQILNAIDTLEANNPEPTGLGVRDRAMLETLYSTGMRRGELVALHTDDLDTQRGTVHIRQGKGAKDRVVPIGERACRWIEKYLSAIRPLYLEASGEPDDGSLFLARHGQGMQGKQLSGIVKKTVEAAQLERFQETHPNAACHLFRHACATHMLEAGADIRYIQALLGHSQLSTTEIYTEVSILQLKAVHERTHPARMEATAETVQRRRDA